MRIAILGPVWKPVPPPKYGGTELIVSLLTEELVKRGHDVTLFASGNSKTSAKLSYLYPKDVHEILGKFDWGNITYNLAHARECFLRAGEFDIIHNHLPEALLFSSFVKTPVVTTMHSSLPPDFSNLSEALKEENYVSISNAQRKNAPYLNWVSTVYHGIDIKQFPFNPTPKDYLLFIGTLGPTKGVDSAVRVARRAGLPLYIVGDRRPEFEEFLAKEVLPFVDGKNIILKNEVDLSERLELYRNAAALLFPIRWNEAFGLVMVEAMACGTPVIAYDNGSVSEIIEDGKTGWVVKSGDEEALLEAIKKINLIDRKTVRAEAERLFNVSRMVQDYEALYKKFL